MSDPFQTNISATTSMMDSTPVTNRLPGATGTDCPADADLDATRVITVRLPKSLHLALKAEAHDRHTSMNQLCIAKLLQAIDSLEQEQKRSS